MATSISTAPLITRVATRPSAPAATYYRRGREHAARVRGFPKDLGLNLRYFGGKTLDRVVYTNVYLGRWSSDDRRRIDDALAAAMTDRNLNNVLAQYFEGDVTAEFVPSRVLDAPVPDRVYRDGVEEVVQALGALDANVVCLLLPRGAVLVDGTAREEGPDSEHGLGGYHGSVHRADGMLYYGVSVYSEGRNGIAVFDEPWKNVCATLYHELCEIRTDPDVEDAIRAGDDPHATSFLGWYSPHGGEIGDIPVDAAGANLAAVFVEVPRAEGEGTVPVQLQWSNAVGGPERPIARKHRPAARA
ncbi:MAG TPA: hypothetical protein VFA56_12195 [Gaiellaceae bacterium]|nr:hypothetical protein [Gaiellaceae bacterium]